MLFDFHYLAVDQRPLYFNGEHTSNHHLSPSSSYRRSACLIKGNIYPRFLNYNKTSFLF